MKKSFVAMPFVLSLTFTSCSPGMSKSTELGIYVCSQIGVIDQFLQEKNTEVDYKELLDALYKYADDAVSFDPDRYGQLHLLVNRFREAVERNDPKGLLSLVAVEGECANLGFM